MRFKVSMVDLDGVIRLWKVSMAESSLRMVCRKGRFGKLRLPLTCSHWQSPGKSPMRNGDKELSSGFNWIFPPRCGETVAHWSRSAGDVDLSCQNSARSGTILAWSKNQKIQRLNGCFIAR